MIKIVNLERGDKVCDINKNVYYFISYNQGYDEVNVSSSPTGVSPTNVFRSYDLFPVEETKANIIENTVKLTKQAKNHQKTLGLMHKHKTNIWDSDTEFKYHVIDICQSDEDFSSKVTKIKSLIIEE